MGEGQAVEIEMEEDFEGHEYDMVDAEEDIDEIRDVEVQDAHSGVSHPDIVTPQISFSLSSETSTSAAEITSLITPAPSIHGVSRQSPTLTHDSLTDQPPPTQETVLSSERTESSDVVLTQSASEVPAEVHGLATEQVQDTVELEHRESEANAPFAIEVAQGDVQHLAAPEASDRAASPPPSEVAQESHPPGPGEAQEAVTGSEQAEDIAPPDPHHVHEDTAAEVSNPHEISEGVYIEPPPGVILAVPSSQQTYSLFNRPSYSGHTTPSREETEAGDDTVVLLLDRPTLFYEPIFSVFEALREEEPFHSSPDLRELELMFSIPSLKLVISEVRVSVATMLSD